jgi:hypothetical protein
MGSGSASKTARTARTAPQDRLSRPSGALAAKRALPDAPIVRFRGKFAVKIEHDFSQINGVAILTPPSIFASVKTKPRGEFA